VEKLCQPAKNGTSSQIEDAEKSVDRQRKLLAQLLGRFIFCRWSKIDRGNSNASDGPK
jgi:hypothetical protein